MQTYMYYQIFILCLVYTNVYKIIINIIYIIIMIMHLYASVCSMRVYTHVHVHDICMFVLRFSKPLRLLYSIIYEIVNFLSSLFTLCYFFLYLKSVPIHISVSPRINEKGGGGGDLAGAQSVKLYLVHVHVHTPFIV